MKLLGKQFIKTGSALVAFVLLFGIGYQGFHVSAVQDQGGSVAVCKCCSDVTVATVNCATTSCCATPASEGQRPAPVSLPASRSQNERNILATTLTATLSFLPHATEQFLSPTVFLPQSRTVPIFQRDCSYLI